MSVATVNRNGQITLPKGIRDRLSVSPGDKLRVVLGDSGEVRLRPISKSFWDLKGRFARPGMKPVTLEEMDEAIARGAARLP